MEKIMPSPREVANLFLREPQEDEDVSSPLRTTSVRMANGLLQQVNAMAEAASISRNEMLLHLIEVGVGAVLAELPDEVREDIEHDRVARMVGGDE